VRRRGDHGEILSWLQIGVIPLEENTTSCPRWQLADPRYAAWGGVTYLAGIYKLEADRLTIFAARAGQGRPSDFNVQDEERLSTLSLQRVDNHPR
jgi:hypothetical protein